MKNIIILLILSLSAEAFAQTQNRSFAEYALYVGMRKTKMSVKKFEETRARTLGMLVSAYNFDQIFVDIQDPSGGKKCTMGMLKITPKNADPSKNPVIFFYGNGENSYISLVKLNHTQDSFIHHGYTVYVPDYPGYGLSECFPQENINIVAGKKAFETVQNLEAKKPILVGYSLGSGIATQVAASSDQSIQSLILISPYAELSNAISSFKAKYGILSFRIAAMHREGLFTLNYLKNSDVAQKVVEDRNKYLSYSYLKDINVPVLILHGTGDTDVLPENSDILAADLQQDDKAYEFYKINGASHGGIFDKKDLTIAPLFWNHIYDFINNPPHLMVNTSTAIN